MHNKNLPPMTHVASASVSMARQQPSFAGYTGDCEDMNQFETDFELFQNI